MTIKHAALAAVAALLLTFGVATPVPGANAGALTPEEVIEAVFDEMNQGDAGDAAAYFAADGVLTDINGGSAAFVGRAAFEWAVQGAIDEDVEITIIEMDTDADGNTVTGSIEWRDDFTAELDIDRYVQEFTVHVSDAGLVTRADFTYDEDDAETAEYLAAIEESEDEGGPPPDAVEVPLAAQAGGNQPGTAYIFELDDGVTGVVVVAESGAAGVLQPAHFHTGTCAAPGSIVEPLGSLLDGFSFTALSTTVDELVDNDLIINVHKSAAEISVYVSCGDVLSAPPAASPTAATAATATPVSPTAPVATATRPTGVTAPDTGTGGGGSDGDGGSALPYALAVLGAAVALLGAGTLARRRG